jgi:Lon protease-like protein
MSFNLPLFPLNTVLFPGMPLTLHIFEERYKRMIADCLEPRQPFGVVLIRHGKEALGPLADPYRIGCTARILDVQPLTDGRMNIVALGQKRFRIIELFQDKPYLVGSVELFPLEETNRVQLDRTGRRLRPWVKRYMEILTRLSDVNLDPQHLPNDPLVLAYLAAVLLHIPPDKKQELLSTPRAVDLLADMYKLYRREVALLQAMFLEADVENAGRFSIN